MSGLARPPELEYRPRLADGELERLIAASGAVVIEGARASGKTQTALRAARSAVRLDVEDDARTAALVAPELLLDGERPRLIDEWQLVPAVWNHVRREVDAARGAPGQFILTGSAVPPDDPVRHSGAGRFTRLRMRPMSLLEAGYSTGLISLSSLFDGAEPRAPEPPLAIADLAERICVGGWPGLQRSVASAQVVLRGYLADTTELDLVRLDGVRRDPEKLRRVIRSLARNTATQVSARAIAADVGGSEGSMDPHTVRDYLTALARVFVTEDLPAWSPAIRSRSILREAPTRHFVDPSLAVAALDTGPDRLLRDVATLGLLFESLVVRDLRIYGQVMDASVFHFRDNTGLEADAVLERRDGRWAAFEVKLGSAAIDDAARSLLRVAAKVDPERHGEPAFLAVVTGWGYGYRRPDGVFVIPIGALGP